MDCLWGGIVLKFLCTPLVWGRWVTLALFDDIILLLKPFLSTSWLTSACTTEPHHYTLTLPTHWQTHTYCFPLGIFREGFGLLILALSTHSHFLLPSVFPTEVHKQPRPFGGTCNFLLCDTDTSCMVFFPPHFCLVLPLFSLSKSRLEPVKGLMRLEFIRQWVDTGLFLSVSHSEFRKKPLLSLFFCLLPDCKWCFSEKIWLC